MADLRQPRAPVALARILDNLDRRITTLERNAVARNSAASVPEDVLKRIKSLEDNVKQLALVLKDMIEGDTEESSPRVVNSTVVDAEESNG